MSTAEERRQDKLLAAISTAMHFCLIKDEEERKALYAELELDSPPIDWMGFLERRDYIYTGGDMMWVKESELALV